MRTTLAGWGLFFAALVLLAIAWGEWLSPLPQTSSGVTFAYPPHAMTIAAIKKNTQAARSGLRVGDVVDLGAMSMTHRIRLSIGTPAGTALRLPILRSGRPMAVTLIRYQRPRPSIFSDGWLALEITATISLLIFAIIGLRKPSIATAALVLYGGGAISTYAATAEFSRLPDPLYGGVAVVILSFFSFLPVFALPSFVARFPSIPPSRNGRRRVHVADALFGVALLASLYEAIFEPVFGVSWPAFSQGMEIAGLLAGLAFASVAFLESTGESRRRIAWVLGGLVVSDIAYLIWVESLIFFAPGATLPAWVLPTRQVADLATTLFPIALAYAILRHRVIDLNFALNRTVVYGLLTTLVVIVVTLVDWITSRLLSQTRLALAVEALVTIGFGLTLNWLHGRVEALVDRIVFRERHVAERRIEQRIAALPYATSETSVDLAMSTEAVKVLQLKSAAVFRRADIDEPFRRVSDEGWPPDSVRQIDRDSLLVRSLLAEERTFFLADLAIDHEGLPHGDHRPILAVPISAQHELLGFALYGAERDGASPDPQKIALLNRLAEASSTAYSMVEARRWRARVSELERRPLRA